MNIFIWKAYGDTRVYAADTVDQLSTLCDMIMSSIEDWDLEELDLNKISQYIKAQPDDPIRYVKAINTMLDYIGVGSTDSFEYSTGFGELIC